MSALWRWVRKADWLNLGTAWLIAGRSVLATNAHVAVDVDVALEQPGNGRMDHLCRPNEPTKNPHSPYSS